MKCPICRENIPEFRRHAMQHVENGEAYGIEVYDGARGVSQLTLHATPEPLKMAAIDELRWRFENATTSIVYRRKLRMINRRQKFVK